MGDLREAIIIKKNKMSVTKIFNNTIYPILSFFYLRKSSLAEILWKSLPHRRTNFYYQPNKYNIHRDIYNLEKKMETKRYTYAGPVGSK